MATTYLWLAIALTAVLLKESNCQSNVEFKETEDVSTLKLSEVIELMRNTNKHNLGIQKVFQENGPDYEILITPNKNHQDQKGSQKIKIYVEAGSYGSNEKKITEPEGARKQNAFDVLPLSIESEGAAVNYQQYTNVPPGKNNFGNHQEYSRKEDESYPSKRQTNWPLQNENSPTAPLTKILNGAPVTENHRIQMEPSYIDQNNPYHPVSAPVKENRHRAESEYSSFDQNIQRIPQKVYDEDYSDNHRIDGHTKAQNLQPGMEYQKTREEAYEDGSIYKSKPSSDGLQSERRAEELRSDKKRSNTGQTVRQVDEKRPLFVGVSEEYELLESQVSNPSREPTEREPTYKPERRPTSVRRPIYNVGTEINSGVAGPGNFEQSRPLDGRDSTYTAEPQTPLRKVTVGEYDSGATDDSSRPVRDNNSGYSGFPESHQPDINHRYSRPLQYEPARAFPASPCLTVFKYEGREPEEDRWYGDIYVTTDEVLNGMRLDIGLDRPAELLTNWLADVKTKDGIHFTLLSLNHKLVPGPAETVRIMVKFNGKKPVPFLKSINLNGRLVCPSNRAQKLTTRKPDYENPGDLQLRRTTSERYLESSKRPADFEEEYDMDSKRTTYTERRTTPLYEEEKKSTVRPQPQYLQPNPNGYTETDLNSFALPTKKPPGRPAHSNGKPPPHAAKPAQGVGQGNNPGRGHGHGHGIGYGQVQNQGNRGNSNLNQGPSGSNGAPPPNPTSNGAHRQIECGTPSVQPSPLITHGQLTSRGQWPWHAALYKNVGTDLTFFCGGSLISTIYVVTAAHCVTKTYTTKPLEENSLVVYLGKYHLKVWSEGGVQNRQVSKIYVHPKYNSTDFRSDIAVLALSTPVQYSDYVRPICLWDPSSTRIEEVEGRLGTVVGWGFDETKMLTEELRQAQMPVVEQKTCLWSYPDFYPQFTSNMTYCAGFKNGTSVCNGDSGGGMVFPYKLTSGMERWHLRGIVSISPARNDSRVCDTSHYVVFTDVAKYLPWLNNFL